MPRQRVSKLPRSYGRQASGKTIKSLSMDVELVQWAESQARAAGLSLSAWLNDTLRTQMGPQGRSAATKAAAKAPAPKKAAPAPKAPAKPAKPAPAAKKAGKSAPAPAKASKAPAKPAKPVKAVKAAKPAPAPAKKKKKGR